MIRISEVGAGVSATRERYLGFLALAAAVLAALMIVGYWPTERLAGTEGISAMIVACGLSLLGSAVGALLFLLVQFKTQAEAMPAVLGSIVLRMALVLAVTTAVAWSGVLANRPFLIWVAISHAALLVVDTRYALAEVRSKPASAGSTGGFQA